MSILSGAWRALVNEYRSVPVFARTIFWIFVIAFCFRIVFPVWHTPDGVVYWWHPFFNDEQCAVAGELCELDRSRTVNTVITIGFLGMSWLMGIQRRHAKISL